MLLFTAIGTCAIKWSEVGITEVVMPGERGLVGQRQTIQLSYRKAIGKR